MSEMGALKFECRRTPRALVVFPGFDALNFCRRRLRKCGLVGVGADGIGFGNLSGRAGLTSGFYITASGTGGIEELELNDYAQVTGWDFDGNWVASEGLAVASSESLTHAAIYEAAADVGAVFHFHSAEMWERLRGVVPTTSPEVDYGTPEMARAVQRLFQTSDLRTRRILVMGGHEAGLVAFGARPEAALDVLLAYLTPRSA
ncbi:MAG: class II aldolase/adducin family protein [Verrucomicrobiota bacterium]|nr:class II aldolase/adducin family protein [Verrucomicrobiota bacterium]